MPRKPPKGYYVRGQFVAYGSAEDAELKRAAKGGAEVSKTDLKRRSAHLQALGERLLTLQRPVLRRLALDDDLLQALEDARRIQDFEGRRRQLQYVGRLMRRLEPAQVAAVEAALARQHHRDPTEMQRLHEAEAWRARLLADDAALEAWREVEPQVDWQRLRALIRQARKDAAEAAATTAGQPARHGRAFGELLQHIHAALQVRAEPPVTA